MNFRTYLLRRTLHIIPVLFGLSILIFVVSRVIPGDPVRLALGLEATGEQVEQLRRQMGLDRPLVAQYLAYFAGAVRGDFGYSLRTHRNVAQDLLDFFPGTLELVMRLIRAGMIEEMRRDYALAARSYGLPPNLIIYKYLLKNAFTATLTILGLSYGFLLGNAFLVEAVFAWPGLAFYGVDALRYKDFNGVIAVTIVIGAAYALVNLATDILYGYVDPRVRYE